MMYFGGYLKAKELELQQNEMEKEKGSMGGWEILEMSKSTSIDAINL